MVFKRPSYQKYAAKLIVSFAIVLINFGYVLPVNALVQELQINSDQGYTVKTTFSYNEVSSREAIAEQGKGKTKAVDNLKVSFYDPSGSMVASYDNIVNGIVQGNYFEFHYDPKTQKLFGEIDLGGDSVGEMYLKGKLEQGLSLIRVETSGQESTIESGQWTVDHN